MYSTITKLGFYLKIYFELIRLLAQVRQITRKPVEYSLTRKKHINYLFMYIEKYISRIVTSNILELILEYNKYFNDFNRITTLVLIVILNLIFLQ